MAFCRYCGQPIQEGSRFCASCGAKLEENQGAAAGEAPAAPPNAGGDGAREAEGSRFVCAISYIGILFFVPLIAYPNSRFAKFHANQALVLLIASIILRTACEAMSALFYALPLLPNMVGNFGGWVFDLAAWALPLAGTIFGFVNAVNGKEQPLPLIGKFNLINK